MNICSAVAQSLRADEEALTRLKVETTLHVTYTVFYQKIAATLHALETCKYAVQMLQQIDNNPVWRREHKQACGQKGNDMVKIKDVRDFRTLAANTTEVTPGNPRRNVTDLPQWALTYEVSSTSPVLVCTEGSSEDYANI
jgi:hypothetical protein